MYGEYKAIDLFPGIGSMTFAAERAGFEVQAVLDFVNDKKAREIYSRNLGERVSIGVDEMDKLHDIVPKCDIMIGNLPWAFFNKSQSNDASVTWEMVWNIVRKNLPQAFFIVLPLGIKRIFGKDGFIDAETRSMYNLSWKILDSGEMTGMPVKERKLYLVGIQESAGRSFAFPNLESSYYYTARDFLQSGITDEIYDVDMYKTKICINEKADFYLWKHRQYESSNRILYGSSMPILVSEDERIRKMTHRELARTKFYPDEFRWEIENKRWLYDQIGKSVNIEIACSLMQQIYKTLGREISYFESRDPVISERAEAAEEKQEIKERQEDRQHIVEEVKEEKKCQEGPKKKIFLSYCQKDAEIVELIENELKKVISDEFYISKDVRDVRYKDSFKKFMRSIREHDYVIMIISDRYIKSRNCMYEVMEVFQDRDYAEKLLFIVLSDDDKKYFKSDINEPIAANIYNAKGQSKYTRYWQKEKRDISQEASEIGYVYADNLLTELREIEHIILELPKFFAYIADAKGLPLKEHINTHFKEIVEKLS